MGIIISDENRLLQELYAKMTQITDSYMVTHQVLYWGDVEDAIEKYFINKRINKRAEQTEPSTYTTYTAYGCSYGKWRTEDEKTCYNCLHYMNGVGCQNREMYHTDCSWK